MKGALFVVLLIVEIVTAVTSGEGCSLLLDGSSYLSVKRYVGGDVAERSVIFENALTFDAWINPSSVSPHDTGIIMQTGRIYSTPAMSYVLSYNYTSSSIVVKVWGYSNFDDLLPNVAYSITAHVRVHKDVWTHVSYNTDTQEFIIGHKISSYIITKESLTDRSPCHFAVGVNFTGAVDNVRVWNTSMAYATLQTVLNGTCSSADMSALILSLSFDDCGVNATADDSASHACGQMAALTAKRNWGRRDNKSHYRKHARKDNGVRSSIPHYVPFALVKSDYVTPVAADATNSTKTRHARNKFGRSTATALVYGPSSTKVRNCEAEIPDTAAQCPYIQTPTPSPTNNPTSFPVNSSSEATSTPLPTNEATVPPTDSPSDDSVSSSDNNDSSDDSSQEDSSDYPNANTTISSSTTTGSSTTSIYDTLAALNEIPLFNMFWMFGIFVILFSSYKLIRKIMKVLKHKKAKKSLLDPEANELEDLDTHYPVQQPATQTQPTTPQSPTAASVGPSTNQNNQYFMYYMPQTQLPRVPGYYSPGTSPLDNE